MENCTKCGHERTTTHRTWDRKVIRNKPEIDQVDINNYLLGVLLIILRA